MEEFKGLCRDTVRAKIYPMQWEFARNILLSKGFTSVTNEDGFDYKHDIPGTFIGKIETNEEIVYFSVDGIYSCIGLYRTNEAVPVYEPIIRTQYLGFKINRPIEGIFFYNYKGELIISFCDGVFLDSNTPKIINCTNIGVDLDANLELVNPADVNQLDLTPMVLSGDIGISYRENGTFEGEVVYVTYAYILGDGITPTPYIPIHNIAYPIEKFRQNAKRDIILDFTQLDLNFTKIKIAILVVTEGGLFAYESSIRNYTGDTYNTTISSLSAYTSISTDLLLIPSVVYNRIKTMTLVNSEMSIGNIATEEEIDFQKYANLLELGLRFDTREEEKHNHPILCPDEVYSFTIALHLLNGSYSKEYHIPGRQAIGNERDDLTIADLTALGIEELGADQVLKRFRIFNNGGWDVITNQCRDVYAADAKLSFGYWENQETYPNDDNFNSLVDYNGNVIVGGQDLRNTPIRYHRIPGLDNLAKNFPCMLGENNRNTDDMVGRDGDPVFRGAVPAFAVNVMNFDTLIPTEIKAKIQGYKLAIVKRTRGDSLVEDINFIKQAYYPSYEGELTYQNSTVIINRHLRQDDKVGPIRETVMQFGFSKVRSTNLFAFTPQITSKLIKANYGINTHLHSRHSSVPVPKIDTLSTSFVEGNVGNVDALTVPSKSGYTLVPDAQRFAVIKDMKYVPGNNIAAKTQYVENSIILTARNSLVPLNVFTETQVATRWNPFLFNIDDINHNSISVTLDGFSTIFLTSTYRPENYPTSADCYNIGLSATFINLLPNVYSGFNPRDFITIGQVSLRNTANDYTLQNQVLRDGGDIFTNNLYNRVETMHIHGEGLILADVIYFNQTIFKGMFGVPNNSEVYLESDRILNAANPNNSEIMNGYNYESSIYRKDVFRSLNDLISGIAFSVDDQNINYFPYRIQRSLKLANENLSTYNIRTFPANKYQEMLNDRGEIIALRGSNKVLYIQQRFSLFIASLKDKLTTAEGVTYLGEGDIFDRTPDEVMDASNKGYLGSSSQFACILYRDGYVTIDQVKGKVYIISGGQPMEISKEDMVIWFEENSNTDINYYTTNRLGIKQVIDNPYTQVGHIIGFDLKYNRLLWTKKDFTFNEDSLVDGEVMTFDGEWYYVNGEKVYYDNTDRFIETSRTFSFSLNDKKWVCEHDYFPNCYAYTNKGTYAITNLPTLSQVYKMNSKLSKGLFFGKTYESYFDPIFNSRLDLTKLYQNITWNTVVVSDDNSIQYFKTIDAIALYNDVQCSGIIDLDATVMRNVEGNWEFNEFRDIVIDGRLPLVEREGSFIASNLNINKSYFEKSSFINTFIVVRMIMRNLTNDSVFINVINVKSRMSKR